MNTATPRDYFDALYAEDDPFGYRGRWYERRKRQLLLASLPAARYASAWEIGCSNGETTACLATRCDRLLATDASERAVALAQARTRGDAHVQVVRACHPQDWPDQQFDLVVFSEVGYYLDRDTLSLMTARLHRALKPGGVLVACHWRLPFAEAPLEGDEVHRALRRDLALPALFRYQDDDVVMDGWAVDAGSVAQRTGVR